MMEIRIRTGNGVDNISILNTYAPHMQYNEDGRSDYWGQVNGVIKNLPHGIIQIWCPHNNGQIANPNRNKQVIGEWAINTDHENGDGRNFPNIHLGNNLICANTFFTLGNYDRNNPATRHKYDGAISRQIHFVAINHRYRNWIDNVNNKYTENLTKVTQRKMVIYNIQIKPNQLINKEHNRYIPIQYRRFPK